MIYSFDIFDTLISRRVASPQGIFHVMQSELLSIPSLLKESQASSFAESRILAEQLARKHASSEDVTLSQIYSKLGAILSLNDLQVQKILSLEISTELKHVIGIPDNLKLVREHVDCGDNVILISDMYLPRDVIFSLLHQAQPDLNWNFRLYLSSEFGKTKATGSLFREVLKSEKISPKELQHFGDNYRSDFLIPRTLGIRCKRLNQAELKGWENIGNASDSIRLPRTIKKGPVLRLKKQLNRYPKPLPDSATQLVWELAAGKAREARLKGHSGTKLFGFSVVAPLLVPYVFWVLHKATQSDVDRLYFVARDGQILYRIAKELQANSAISMPELNYIYGSRQAWHLPAITDIGERELEWMLETRKQLTIEVIAKRLELAPSILLDIANARGCAIKLQGSNLGINQLEKLRVLLGKDEEIKSRILASAQLNRNLLFRYLKDRKFFEADHPAIVDMGWTGRMLDSFNFALSAHPGMRGKNVDAFFFGQALTRASAPQPNARYPYAISPSDFTRTPVRYRGLVHLLEIFASADHGSTMGYRNSSSGEISPLLDGQGKGALEWGVRDLQEGVLEFAKDYNPVSIEKDRESVKIRLMDLFQYARVDKPDLEFAKVLGSFPYTTEQEGGNVREFAPLLSTSASLKYLFSSSATRNSLTLWPEGSAARSSTLASFLLARKLRVFTSYLRPRHAIKILARTTADLLPDVYVVRIRQLLPIWIVNHLELLLTGRRITKR